MPLISTRGAASAQGFGEFAQSVPGAYIEDVFSTWLYTGNGSTQTITNGVDLSGKGGLVWMKSRSAATSNVLYDTVRGATKQLVSDTTAVETTQSTGLTAFGSTGFTVDSLTTLNANNGSFVSWTFREQAKFFDVVTYTGDGVAGKTVTHNLGSAPGMMIVKRISGATAAWQVYHRSLGATQYFTLDSVSLPSTSITRWNNTAPTATQFTLGDNSTVNGSGNPYVAYLFAHNAGGFGASSSDNAISCGSYTSTTGATQDINLGYEPQWILIRSTTSGAVTGTFIFDVMRGMSYADDFYVYANSLDAETNIGGSWIRPTATGFTVASALNGSGTSGYNFIYVAIRRGPMKPPTSSTSVFTPIARTGTGANATITTGFVTDLSVSQPRTAIGSPAGWFDRLRGETILLSSDATTGNQTFTNSLTSFASNTGIRVGADSFSGSINLSGVTYANWDFRRAPGFFDVVCYTGAGTNTTQAHNLGVAPELMFVKRRGAVGNWAVYSAAISNTEYLYVNSTAAKATDTTYWNSITPTASVFSIGTNVDVNASGSTGTYVAYLFATLAGISKVGSYTGTGATQTINCGFTAGSRFVLIKATSTTGSWYVWDSARGIVAGNDPYLLINSTAAEVTNTDWVDTASTGFELSNAGGNLVNSNGVSYIFLAIA